MKIKPIFLIVISIFATILFEHAAKADEIDQLVADLSNTNRLWSWNSGTYVKLNLPGTTSTDDVIKRILDANQPKGRKADYNMLSIRQVRILNGVRPNGDLYNTALVIIDGSKKIIVFSYWGPALGWWSRIYNSKSEALGCIDLSVKNAKLRSEFIWPKRDGAEVLIEHSGLNDHYTLTHPHTPFTILMEITDKRSGQMVVSNSLVAMQMRSDSVPMPTDRIRLNDYNTNFTAGDSYVLFLQVLQETKGLGCGNVYVR